MALKTAQEKLKPIKHKPIGKRKKPEGEPQTRDPSPWECRSCHIYKEHQIIHQIIMGNKKSMGPGPSSGVLIRSSGLLVHRDLKVNVQDQ